MYSYATTVTNTSSNTAFMVSAPVININHPYYLSSSAYPGISLVNEVLTDQNCHTWRRSIKIALSAKLKLRFIDCTQVKPAANSPLLSLWMRSNDLVISWLLNSISSYIRKSVVYMTTAKQIWHDLVARYLQSNVPRLFHLRKELASLTQGTRSVTAYFSLIDELDSISPIPRCTCANSNCNCLNSVKLDHYEHMTAESIPHETQ